MAYSTGLRLLAALNFALCLTVVLAPVCAPLGAFFLWQARKKERTEEAQQDALERLADGE